MKIYLSYKSVPELKSFSPEEAKELYLRYSRKTFFYWKRLIGMGLAFFCIILWDLLLKALRTQWGIAVSLFSEFVLLMLFWAVGLCFYSIFTIEVVRSALREDRHKLNEKPMD